MSGRNEPYGRGALKAARRLLEVCRVDNEIAEVSASASLAGALQAVLIADILRSNRADSPEATHALVGGIASAVGFVLSKGPRDSWEDGLDYLTKLARAATEAHAAYEAHQGGPGGATIQ